MKKFLEKISAFLTKAGEWLSRMLAVLSQVAWFKIAKIAACAIVVLLLIFYGSAALFNENGGFTVSFVKNQNVSEGKISLSEQENFSNPTVKLSADGVEEMDNISGEWLPEDVGDHAGGSHNGDNYIAYTFYAKNTGTATCILKAEMQIDNVYKGAENAIRIRVYRNGETTTYAKLAANGEPEPNTVPFLSDEHVFIETDDNFEVGKTIKYTFVIWLEGDDPECLDNIKGGKVRMSLTFSVESPDKN